MAETFTKLFSSILGSSLWSESDSTRLVWVTLLAMADKNGYVGASVPGIAAMARVSVEQAEEALAVFLAPDRYSRSKDHDGRRIEEVDRGWVLLNYDRFRDMRDEDSRREYERKRKAEQRARKRAGTVPGRSGTNGQCPAVSAQAEAEADAEEDSEVHRASTAATALARECFDRFWKTYDKRKSRKPALAKWLVVTVATRTREGKSVKVFDADLAERIIEAAAAYVRTTPDKQFRKNATTWLNQECWDDELIRPGGQASPKDHLTKRVGDFSEFASNPVQDL